jgi:hypothetical protein
VLARFVAKHGENWSMLPQKAMFQMNDTHPTIAVAELMRLLLDEHSLDWDTAWGLTKQVSCYPGSIPVGCPDEALSQLAFLTPCHHSQPGQSGAVERLHAGLCLHQA